MAINNTTKDFSSMEFPMEIKRQDAFALDPTSVWKSFEEAQSYAQTNPTAYVGQVIAVIIDGVADIYKIKDEAGTLEKIGSDKDEAISNLSDKITKLEESQTEQDLSINKIKDGTMTLPYLKDTGDIATGDYDFTRATVKVAEPVEDTNVTSKKYVDDKIQNETTDRKNAIDQLKKTVEENSNSFIKKSGDSMTGPLNVIDPTKDTHATNKKYVDESVASVYPTEVVSGNPVVCENSVEYGLLGLKVYGKSTQDGTPSPESPVPIVSAGDRGSVEIAITGANLLDPNGVNVTLNGVNISEKNNDFYISGTATDDMWIEIKRIAVPAGQFTFSCNDLVNRVMVQYRPIGSSENFTVTTNNSQACVVAMFSEPMEAKFLIGCEGEKTYEGQLNAALNLGSKILTWQPYTGQSLTLSTPNGLPGIQVNRGGNYTDASGQQWVCDEIDFARGVYVQRVERITFNGSSDELWAIGTNGATQRNYFWITLEKAVLRKDPGVDVLLCQAFSHMKYGYTEPSGNNTACFQSNNLNFTCSTSLFNNVDDWRQYLIGNAMALIYAIANPIETPLSEEEIAAYRALHTYPGTTIISSSEDIAGIETQFLKKPRALPSSQEQDSGRVVIVNDKGEFSLSDKYLDGVDLDSIFSLFIDGKNTTDLFWKWYPLTDKYGSTKYSRLERWCKLLANAWSNKTYTLRFYEASVSGDYTGIPLDDLADGRQAAPLVTDSSEPTEDWAENDPMTWYIRANALSLADGTMDILYFEGEDGFDITGEIAPVYSFALNLYLKHWTDNSYKYTSWKTVKADGYKSMAEGIAPDNSYRTVTWHPSFNGGLNASGGLTSGANKKPVIWTSAQDALSLAREITPYEGLWTDCDQQYVLSQWQLRHWTLENSDVLNGCQNYNYQYTLAVAESDVKRVIVTKEQGANFIVGSNVCLGEKGVNENPDRNQAYNHDIFSCATITSIENVNISEAEYTALNLDIEEPITTTTTMFVSTIPWSSGTSEALQGHSDGCIGNLTNGKYPIRIAGIEIMNGANIEELDPLWQASIVEGHWKYEVYSCRDSEKQAGSITGNYEKIGEFNLASAAEYTWFWVKDMNELESEAMIPLEFGGSSSTYYRSAVSSPGGSGGLRSPARGGTLPRGAASGLVCARGDWAPSWSTWSGAARLTGAGKKRGESAP